jgi:hypothetical protein
MLDELQKHRASFVTDADIQTLFRVLETDYRSDPKTFFVSKLELIGSTPEEFALKLELEDSKITSSETASSVPNGKQSKSVTFEETNGVDGYDEWDGFDVSPLSDKVNSKPKANSQNTEPFYEVKASSNDEWGSGEFDESNGAGDAWGETSEDLTNSTQNVDSEVEHFGDSSSESDWGESGFDESTKSDNEPQKATETDGMSSDESEDNGFSEEGNLELF